MSIIFASRLRGKFPPIVIKLWLLPWVDKNGNPIYFKHEECAWLMIKDTLHVYHYSFWNVVSFVIIIYIKNRAGGGVIILSHWCCIGKYMYMFYSFKDTLNIIYPKPTTHPPPPPKKKEEKNYQKQLKNVINYNNQPCRFSSCLCLQFKMKSTPWPWWTSDAIELAEVKVAAIKNGSRRPISCIPAWDIPSLFDDPRTNTISGFKQSPSRENIRNQM